MDFTGARYLLSAGDRTLLRAAVAKGDDAIEAYADWRRDLDWAELPARWHRLLPLLHQRMTGAGIQDELLERIAGVRRYLWAQNLRIMALAREVHAAFAARGVPALALKGSALVAHGFTDRSVRPMDDIDVLVERGNVEAAMNVLETLGLAPTCFRKDSILARLVRGAEVSGWAFAAPDGRHVDLHWASLHLDRRPEADKDVWARAVKVDFERVAMTVPAPEDLFLQICVHGAKNGGEALLRALADASIILETAPSFNWEAVQQSAAAHRVSEVMTWILATLSEALPGGEIDPPIRRLRRQAGAGERLEAWAERKASASEYRLAELLVAASDERRRRSRLFDRALPYAVASRLKASCNTSTATAGAKRHLYRMLGCPVWLRSAIASDRHLDLPAAADLMLLDGQTDVAAVDLCEASFVTGWSLAEHSGRWTDGPSATLALRVRHDSTPRHVRLGVRPALRPGGPDITVRSFVDDRFAQRRVFQISSDNEAPFCVDVPEDGRLCDGLLTISFEIAEPFCPRACGQSQDPRRLGLFLHTVAIRAGRSPTTVQS